MPAGQLVGPEAINIEPAGPLGHLAAQADRPGPVGPFNPALRPFKTRPVPRRGDVDQAGWSFDHHVSNVGRGGGDQAAELHRAVVDPLLNPQRARPRLASTSAGDISPDPPIARGRRWVGRARMRAALPERQTARTGFGIPIPGRAVGQHGRNPASAGFNPPGPCDQALTLIELLLKFGHAIFKFRELRDGHHVRNDRLERGQLDRFGDRTLCKGGDPLGRPVNTVRHVADGAIERTTATPFDPGLDLGIGGPAVRRGAGTWLSFAHVAMLSPLAIEMASFVF